MLETQITTENKKLSRINKRLQSGDKNEMLVIRLLDIKEWESKVENNKLNNKKDKELRDKIELLDTDYYIEKKII